MIPKVSIIILNYNGWKDTIECLESVLRNNYPNYQVILIDNNSSNNSMEYIKLWADGKQEVLTPKPSHPLYSLSHPPIKKPIPYIFYLRDEAEKGGNHKLEEKFKNTDFQDTTTKYPLIFIQTGKNLGFAGGNNVGIKYVLAKDDSDYILLLNNDTVVDKNFISELVKYFDKSTGICAPLIKNFYKPTEIWSSGGKFNILTGIYSNNTKFIKSDQQETNFISGCCWLVKKTVFKKIGLLDERYFLYSEDVDFCYRLRQQGYKLKIIPSSIIFHKVSESTKNESSIRYYYFHRSKLIFINKNYNRFKRFFYLNINKFIRYIRILEYSLKGKKDIAESIKRALKEYKYV